MSLPSKRAVREALLAHLLKELERARASAETTRSGAVHEESRAENDKDTRGLEQSYLARGQAKRVAELESALTRIKTLSLPSAARTVVEGSLTRVLVDEQERLLFVAPAGGGETVEVDGSAVTVITLASPVGRALARKEVDDEIELRVAGRARLYTVLDIA